MGKYAPKLSKKGREKTRINLMATTKTQKTVFPNVKNVKTQNVTCIFFFSVDVQQIKAEYEKQKVYCVYFLSCIYNKISLFFSLCDEL